VSPRTLLLVLLTIGLGCSNDPPAARESGGAKPAAPAGSADACAEIRRRFDAALATRTDACATDADCGCYNPVAGPHLGCGGVTDAATVARLAAIQQEFHAKQCAWTHNCAAWACAPKCVSKRCSQ